MLPEGWESKKLGSISSLVTSGSRDWAQFYSDTGSKFIRMTNLRRDSIYLKMDDLKFVDVNSDSADGKRTSLQTGDILISITAELGKIGWIHFGLGQAFINQHTALVRVKPKDAESKFIAYLLCSGAYHRRINSLNDAGAKAGLNLATIRTLDITLPPQHEQKKIAQILSTWDNAILATERLLENSQQRKKALMQQLLTGKKRLPGFEGEWSKVELGDLGYTYGGLTGKTKEDFGSGEPYITYMSVFADGAIIPDKFDYVKLKEGEKQHSVEYGDILFTTSSETPEEVGMASVMLERLPLNVYLNSFCFGFRLSSLDVLIPEYAKYYMRSESIRRAIANLAQGATRYNLSKKQLLKISLHLPSISEQQTIANILTTADQEIDALQKRLDHLRLEKKSLMQQLLTGKRRVLVDTAA
ncbi:restriction endonuclease subunit S [Morganella sp. GD04133]|uniref:restriction endonuclease subunit S n=1 Tax=Morganella sp. GD04133 TaxID=2975435 RepID=UPI002447444A|nr:restriction endonuclease subunit S [Morganella sp. GD04133]MDH0357050.1 restriction endonuclease subunit S [Morganella sp. GD04133]